MAKADLFWLGGPPLSNRSNRRRSIKARLFENYLRKILIRSNIPVLAILFSSVGDNRPPGFCAGLGFGAIRRRANC